MTHFILNIVNRCCKNSTPLQSFRYLERTVKKTERELLRGREGGKERERGRERTVKRKVIQLITSSNLFLSHLSVA